jgi:hypothetical protein
VLDGNVELATGSIITGAATAFGTDAAAQVAQIGKITGGGVTITGNAGTTAVEFAAFAAIASTNVTASNAITDLSTDVTNFLVAKGNVITLGSVTAAQNITVNGTLKVPSGAATFAPTGDIVVAAGGELNLVGSANLTVAGGKTLTLTGAAATGGAKLTGAGKVVAGKTEIVGDTGWQAVGTGTVEIKALTGTTASITASAPTAVLTAAGGTPAITQAAGSELTIAANTTVHLAGTASTAVGSITLTAADGSGGAKLSFAAISSKVLAGNETAGTALSGTPVKIGGKTLTLTTLTAANVKNGSTGNKVIEVGGAAGSIEANTDGETIVISSAVAGTVG